MSRDQEARLNFRLISRASRPALVVEAVRTAVAFRTRHGVLPSRDLLDWRVATAYGSADASIPPEDLERFLRWRRDVRRMT